MHYARLPKITTSVWVDNFIIVINSCFLIRLEFFQATIHFRDLAAMSFLAHIEPDISIGSCGEYLLQRIRYTFGGSIFGGIYAAGTTRDIVEGSLLIKGIEVNLYDTAGIRETDEVVESIGIQRSIKMLENSDLVMFVIDSSSDFESEDKLILDKLDNKKVLVVYNKIDLGSKKIEELNKYDSIKISSNNKENIELLKSKISSIFSLDDITNSDYTYISNARQISLLKKCLNIINDIKNELKNNTPVDLLEINVKLLWELLGEITGEVYKDELLDEIFSKFCLGK